MWVSQRVSGWDEMKTIHVEKCHGVKKLECQARKMHEASQGRSNQAVRIFYFFLMMARCQTQRIGRGF